CSSRTYLAGWQPSPREFNCGARTPSPLERASSSPCLGLSFTTRAFRHSRLRFSCSACEGPCGNSGEGREDKEQGKPYGLPVGASFISHNKDCRAAKHRRRHHLGLPTSGRGAGIGKSEGEEGDRRPGERSEREILVARVEHEPKRNMDRGNHGGNEQCGENHADRIGPPPARLG